MPTESSAVSRLIHQVHTRRLGTDPTDSLLFESSNIAQRPRERVARRVDAVAQQPVYPTAPQVSRERAWPWVVATVIALGLGVGAAIYVVDRGVLDAPAAVVEATVLPAAPPAAAPTMAMAMAPQVEPILEAPASPPPAVEAPPPAPPPPTVHRRVKSKRVTAKRPSKKTVAKTPAVEAEAAPPPSPPPPPPVRRQRQAADSENPL